MRRTRWIIAGGLALALIVGVGATIASGSPHITQARTIRFDALTVEFNSLDLGAPGPSQGDEVIFKDVLKQEGKAIGHDGGSCVQTSNEGEFNCLVTLALSGGHIAAQLLITPSAQGTFAAIFPVTGGDGIYGNVRGQGRINQVSPTLAHITLNLIP